MIQSESWMAPRNWCWALSGWQWWWTGGRMRWVGPMKLPVSSHMTFVICSESREQIEDNWKVGDMLWEEGLKNSRTKAEHMCVIEIAAGDTVNLQIQHCKVMGTVTRKTVKKRIQASRQARICGGELQEWCVTKLYRAEKRGISAIWQWLDQPRWTGFRQSLSQNGGEKSLMWHS